MISGAVKPFILILVLISLTSVSLTRNSLWITDVQLWGDTVVKNPRSVRANLNLGAAYNEKGVLDTALHYYRIAVDLNPNSSEAHNGLGVVYMYQDRLDAAYEQYTAAIRLNPNHAATHYNMGLQYLNRGESYYDKAAEEFEAAIRIDPFFDDAVHLLLYIKKNGPRAAAYSLKRPPPN